jgi:hypothetical protein
MDALTCAECEARLPAYLADLGPAKSADVARHLTGCPHCAAEYAALQALYEAALAPGMPPTESTPLPDLSFLAPRERVPRWQGRLVVALTAEIKAALATEPPALVPQARGACAAVGLKSGAAAGEPLRLDLGEAGADLEVTLQAEPDRTDPARCALSVQVEIPSRGGWPDLAGTEVALCRAAARSDTRWTDAHGKVVFEDLLIDELDRVVLVIAASDP